MEVVNYKVNDLVPYLRNAKKHDEKQISNVAESIKQFGMVQPIVVDNPPFSILAEIRKFYNEKGIRYFLFAPSLTFFNTDSTAVCTNISVTYENGARVNTSFITNMDSCQVRTAPELFKSIEKQNKINEKEMKAELPKYEYPDYVITSTRMGIFSKYGIDFRIPKEGCHFIRCLDAQKEKGKAIFGSGFLLSESQKAERWKLSDREMEIVKSLK